MLLGVLLGSRPRYEGSSGGRRLRGLGGIGSVAATLIGIAAFDERLSAIQNMCSALVLIGAVGLQVANAA